MNSLFFALPNLPQGEHNSCLKPLTQLRRLLPSTPSKEVVYKLTCICSAQLQGLTWDFKIDLSWFSHAATQVYIPVLSLTRQPALVQHVHRYFRDLIQLTTTVTKIKNKKLTNFAILLAPSQVYAGLTWLCTYHLCICCQQLCQHKRLPTQKQAPNQSLTVLHQRFLPPQI